MEKDCGGVVKVMGLRALWRCCGECFQVLWCFLRHAQVLMTDAKREEGEEWLAR